MDAPDPGVAGRLGGPGWRDDARVSRASARDSAGGYGAAARTLLRVAEALADNGMVSMVVATKEIGYEDRAVGIVQPKRSPSKE